MPKQWGRHRGTLQEWLRIYRTEGLAGLEIVKSSPGGGNRVIPTWAEESLSKRLQDPENGFDSDGAVQEWLSETLGVEAEYHAVLSNDPLSAQSQAKSSATTTVQARSTKPFGF